MQLLLRACRTRVRRMTANLEITEVRVERLQDIRDEAIQTAAMALRLAMSLPCYQYRRAPQHSQGGDNLPDDYEV